MSKFIDIEVVNADIVANGFRNANKDFKQALKDVLNTLAIRAESIAKLRLSGGFGSLRHWITGRLASSVHWESPDGNSFKGNSHSKTRDGRLGEPVGDLEIIVGTNVEYAAKIESIDSFIVYAGEKVQQLSGAEVEKEFNRVTKKYNRFK